MVKQAAREHAEQHKKMLTQTLTSIGQQMPPPDQQNAGGSQPAPKGQPSPPKDSKAPGGPATMSITGAS
jgi:hypothetical protein